MDSNPDIVITRRLLLLTELTGGEYSHPNVPKNLKAYWVSQGHVLTEPDVCMVNLSIVIEVPKKECDKLIIFIPP